MHSGGPIVNIFSYQVKQNIEIIFFPCILIWQWPLKGGYFLFFCDGVPFKCNHNMLEAFLFRFEYKIQIIFFVSFLFFASVFDNGQINLQ